MATITTRSGKGSPLTNNEVDANFTNLNTDKLEDAAGSAASDGNEYVRKDGAWAVATGGGGGANVTTSATAPSSPSDGDLWFSETNGVTYVYYNDGNSSQWVASGAPVLEQFQAAGTSVGTLQTVTNNGATTTNNVSVAGLTASSLNSLVYPSTDGLDSQVLKTDGSGNVAFAYAKLPYLSAKISSNTNLPSSGSFINPVGSWTLQSNGNFPAGNKVNTTNSSYLNLIDGIYLISLMLAVTRSDTGASIPFQIKQTYSGAVFTLGGGTIPAGTASSSEIVTFTTIANVNSARLFYIDLDSTFSSTAAVLTASTIINFVRIAG